MNRLFVEVHDAELQNELINEWPKAPADSLLLSKENVTMYNLPKDVKTIENAKKDTLATNPKCEVTVD